MAKPYISLRWLKWLELQNNDMNLRNIVDLSHSKWSYFLSRLKLNTCDGLEPQWAERASRTEGCLLALDSTAICLRYNVHNKNLFLPWRQHHNHQFWDEAGNELPYETRLMEKNYFSWTTAAFVNTHVFVALHHIHICINFHPLNYLSCKQFLCNV